MFMEIRVCHFVFSLRLIFIIFKISYCCVKYFEKLSVIFQENNLVCTFVSRFFFSVPSRGQSNSR